MVNLRQSMTTFRKKGKDGIISSSSPSAKFRKSVMASIASPSGVFKKDKYNPDDLSSHIGEIKMSVSQDRGSALQNRKFASVQGFTVEQDNEDIVVQDDLARKTDLKLQERREQRRKRQEELQKQLQQKLHHPGDNTNPSLKDDDFPGSLPLHTDSEEPKPRAAGGRKSTMIRNRRAGTATAETERKSSGNSHQSPGRRMARKSRMVDSSDAHRGGVRPPPLTKETSGEHGGVVGTDEEIPLVDRSSQMRMSRRKDDGSNGGTNNNNKDLGHSTSGHRRERRKTEFGTRSQERADAGSSSPGALSTSKRSSEGASRRATEIRGRLRQQVRAVKDMPEIMGEKEANIGRHSTGTRASDLDESIRSTDFVSPKAKQQGPSRDEGHDQRGLTTQSEHRRTSRSKRREKMEAVSDHSPLHSPLHQSEHGGKGRVVRRSERMSPKAQKRKTFALGIKNKAPTDSPQSETRRLRKESRKSRRESETWRTNRSLDDDLIFDNLVKATGQKEKSNGVRFKEGVKDKHKSPGQISGERRKSLKSPGTPSKKHSPRASPKNRLSPKKGTAKEANSKAAAVATPPIWDEEYGAKEVPAKKKPVPSWAPENGAEVYEPLKGDGSSKHSPKLRRGSSETMEDASDSQHDFDYEKEERNRRPDMESGDAWLEPLGDDEIPLKAPANESVPKGDIKDGPKSPKAKAHNEESKAAAKIGKKTSPKENKDEVVGENQSESSGEYSSDESAATPEIPGEVPIADVDYSHRVSVLPMHGVSSSEEEEEEEESEDESSSDESGSAGEIPAVVSVEGSLRGDISDNISSVASMDSAGSDLETATEEGAEEDRKPSAYKDQILPSSFRKERSIDLEEEEEDIPPPPPYPPSPSPPKTNGAKGKKTGNEDGKFDDMFSNEIAALQGTLQDMGDLAQPTPIHANHKSFAEPMDYKFLVDILDVIVPLSSEQKAMLTSDPVAREKVTAAVAAEEKRNKQQMIEKVELLESKLSKVQNDLEKEQLEAAANKMQVTTQDMVITDYKEALESLSQKVQSLEQEKDAVALKSMEQEEKAYKMMESLEETKQLVKEQQMFMNAQQRQMQTMESKIKSLQESSNREESKLMKQNERLREVIRIQKDTIMRALGNHEETEIHDA